MQTDDRKEFNINGTKLEFDGYTGELLRISNSKGLIIAEAESSAGSGVDMAYPIGKFEIQRAGTRYGAEAAFSSSEDGVKIIIAKTGMSHPEFQAIGPVKTILEYNPAPDGKSIIMKCVIENESDNEIQQVLFPDMDGLLPVEGEEGTFLTTCFFRKKPFKELKASSYGEHGFYGHKKVNVGEFYTLLARWLDIGGYKGGMSLYQRWWGWGPDDEKAASQKFWSKLDQLTGKLRIAAMHNIIIKRGEKWESCEHWLTVHEKGWGSGIEPFAEYVSENSVRVVPMPKHIKEGMGFRSVWMSEQYPEAKESIVWEYKDLPAIARETKEHGIDEIVLWGMNKWEIPFTEDSLYEQLGGKESFAKAMVECKKIGVSIVPFVSYMSLWNETAEKFGLKLGKPEDSWSYHTKLVPVFRPSYAFGMCFAWCKQEDRLWQQEVKKSLMNHLEMGMPSISWDQFCADNISPNMMDIVGEYRKKAYEVDKEASFSGEYYAHIEYEVKYLDYTWNWLYWSCIGDMRAFTNAFPAPRMNLLIDGDPMDVRHAFMDNLFMCPWPSKPGGINGSALYSECPDLSFALKQCSALRKEFLEYFTEGRMLGDCLLTKECTTARINAYKLQDRMLVIVLNDTDSGRISFDYDVEAWLGEGNYRLEKYDNYGDLIVSIPKAVSCGTLESEVMDKGQFAFYEFVMQL